MGLILSGNPIDIIITTLSIIIEPSSIIARIISM